MLQFRKCGYDSKEVGVLLDAIEEGMSWLENIGQNDGRAYSDMFELRAYLMGLQKTMAEMEEYRRTHKMPR